MTPTKGPILLLTDFGTRDPYVAMMKSVITSRTTAPVDELTHEIAPHDVFEAAWFLREVWEWLPEQSVVVAVVDPGVGTDRRILAGSGGSGRWVLAPDNGLLTLLPLSELREVWRGELFLPSVHTTFDGRDRFAPVAAALAEGLDPRTLGPLVTDPVPLSYDPPQYERGLTRGTVVAVDRFGNLITDIETKKLPPLETLRAICDRATISRSARTYEMLRGSDEPFLIGGSRGTVEVSIFSGSAADVLQIARLARIELRPRS